MRHGPRLPNRACSIFSQGVNFRRVRAGRGNAVSPTGLVKSKRAIVPRTRTSRSANRPKTTGGHRWCSPRRSSSFRGLVGFRGNEAIFISGIGTLTLAIDPVPRNRCGRGRYREDRIGSQCQTLPRINPRRPTFSIIYNWRFSIEIIATAAVYNTWKVDQEKIKGTTRMKEAANDSEY